MSILRPLFLSTALALTPAIATAQDLTDDRIKQLALQAILENPDIVMEAVAIIRAREEDQAAAAAEQALAGDRGLLENDPNAPVLGNPEGDVTIVEFFDYNCPYCRRAGEAVTEVLAADDNVRVVYREWPILGDGSVFAARAALAARSQDKYEPFHKAMMGQRGRLNETSVMKLAADVGLDIVQLRADMDAPEVAAHIETSLQLAQTLGFSGTPSFVIGNALAPGLVSAEQMLEMIAETRAAN